VGGLLVLLWLAPMIVGHTGLLNWVVGMASADLNGEVSVRSASLGWFSAPRLSNVEVRDKDGERVLEVPEVAGDRSLLSLLFNSSDLGQFRLVKPTFHVVLREDGSNLEDVLAKYLEPKTEPPTRVDAALEILDGTVFVLDPHKQRTWEIEDFQLSLAAPADQARPLDIESSGQVTNGDRPARFDVAAKIPRSGADSSSGETSGGANQLKLRTESFPLEMLVPALARFASDFELGGRLTSSVECSFQGTPAPGAATIEGRLLAEQLILAMPALGGDRVALAQMDTNCKLNWQKDRLQIDHLTAESDVGNVSVSGVLELSDKVLDNLVASVPQQTFEVGGQLDVARLAAILPNTLRIREGTEVNSGQLQLALASKPGRYGMTWEGRLAATDLAATNRGRPIRWEHPIRVDLSARETAQGPVLERLNCESDFLSLNVVGDASRLSATADFDMSQLATRLGAFMDVGGVRFGGSGRANVHWVRSESGQFQTKGDFEARNFELVIPDRPSWKENKLTATFTANGKTDLATHTQLDTAELDIYAGTEQLSARLVEPVVDLHDGGIWTVGLDSSGQLAPWLGRVSPWVVLQDWKLGGTYQMVALATGSATAVQIHQSQVTVGQLRAQSPSMNLVEPSLEAALSGSWDSRRRRLELKSASLDTSSASALAEELVFALSDKGQAELAGTVSCRGQIEKVQKWFTSPDEPLPLQFGGNLAGRAEFRQVGAVISGKFDTTVDNLVAKGQSSRELKENQVRFSGQGTYDNATRTLRVSQAELTSGTVAARVAGQLAMADTTPNLQVEGQLGYDMERLCDLFKSQTGGNVQLTGRGAEDFSYRGPIWPQTAEGHAAVGWDRGDVYGFQLGRSRLEALLARGTLQIRPVSLDVSEGRLFLAPELRFSEKSALLEMPGGRLAERVRINPKMCAHFLQYIAPVLAGVATAEGAFSIELDGCRIPLDNPSAGEVGGRMTVHAVRIGPGPLIREMAVVLGRDKAAELKRESVIDFRLVDGRVYHKGLEMAFPDVTVRTYGSVGLDQTLSIMAEMPVPPKWQAGGMLGSALRDQTLRLPIAGTLSKPSIDKRVFDQLQGQVLQKAAENVLGDELHRGLDRLFRSTR
jgi:hypothetical protein